MIIFFIHCFIKSQCEQLTTHVNLLQTTVSCNPTFPITSQKWWGWSPDVILTNSLTLVTAPQTALTLRLCFFNIGNPSASESDCEVPLSCRDKREFPRPKGAKILTYKILALIEDRSQLLYVGYQYDTEDTKSRTCTLTFPATGNLYNFRRTTYDGKLPVSGNHDESPKHGMV